jgi:hypothetical protein
MPEYPVEVTLAGSATDMLTFATLRGSSLANMSRKRVHAFCIGSDREAKARKSTCGKDFTSRHFTSDRRPDVRSSFETRCLSLARTSSTSRAPA